MALSSHNCNVNIQMGTLREEYNNTNVQINSILPDQALNGLFGQSDECHPNDVEVEIEAEPFEEEIVTSKGDLDDLWLHMLPKIKQQTILLQHNMTNGKTETLPTSSKDLLVYTAPKRAVGFMEYLCSILYSVYFISPRFLGALHILCFSILRNRAEKLTAQFNLKFVNSHEAAATLSFGNAFTGFFTHMIDSMMIMLCYLLILWLVCPLHPVLQILIIIMWIVAPLYYIPDLLGLASGVSVSFGFLGLPLVCFTALGALVFTLICILLSLVIIYLIRRYIHPGDHE